MSGPTPEQISDAIEILSMCEPIREVQGGMWFGNNQNFADATFVDYGACRAFAVAARALPFLMKREDALVKALEKVRSYNVDIIANRINYRPRDHIQIIDEALASIKERA